MRPPYKRNLMGNVLLRWMLGWWFGLIPVWAFAAGPQPVDVTLQDRQNVTHTAGVCFAAPSATLEQVQGGQCQPVSIPQRHTSLGFDTHAWWLKLDLHNPSASWVERWLVTGHPRLQQVSMFDTSPEKQGAERRSGIHTPQNQKPLSLAKPAFDIELAPGEHKTVWLRVASESSIDIGTELWPPKMAAAHQQRIQFFTALALGVMLLCMAYSLASYAMLREPVTLYFSLFMLAELWVELARDGALQLHLWPENWPFDLRFFAAACGAAVVCFALFIRAFLPPAGRQQLAYRVYLGTVAIFLAGVVWCLFVDYRQGARLWTMVLLPMAVAVVGVSVLAWREGVASARLLLQSFLLMLLVESIRVLSILGWVEIAEFDEAINPWAFALATAFIMVSTHRRSREIQNSLQASQRESAARLQFMSQMSHELRSPLTTLLGRVRLLTDMATTLDVRRAARAMGRDAAALLANIDDILDYARGSAGRWQLQPRAQNWGRLLRHIEQGARVLAQANGNRFSFDLQGPPDALFMIDERRLQQVLDNLLTNAARYTQNGDISLNCWLENTPTNTQGWVLCFAVRDSGPGVPAQDQNRIFEPFERGAQAQLTEHKGIGMGLAIARQLIETMGGTLALNSQPGQGATFTVRLPCRSANPQDLADTPQQEVQDTWLGNFSDEAPPLEPDLPAERPAQSHLKALGLLIENGQITDIVDWAHALKQDLPDCIAYSEAVKQAATDLDFPRLRQLANMTPTDKPDTP